ncbi:MAG: hypothetical protein SAJ12_07130 [Jaaginema sp. PMC 1079.18]|nr:hypothetical protein [Jaaginema sp. PMC 1080.18]MEC4850769.1 hypothetical protein [Jaaginema sp. PMC 1079.18]MEC4866996.1 hypothetical protein [Jaaginema sp. PMC 1078.18]
MSASDEFKQKLKNGEIAEALTMALGQAVDLEITTWVSAENSSQTGPTPGGCMRTRMNLVESTVENEVGTQFIGNGPYRELRDFHLSQVHDGRQILQQNLESLQQVFTILTSTMPRLPQDHRQQPAIAPGESED